jgi:hypothetical protein
MKAEQWLRNRWGEIYIPKRETDKDGLMLHLATRSPDIKSSENSQFVGGDIQWDTFQHVDADLRLHLSDTSNGINYGDDDKGLKVYGAVTGGSTEQKPAKNMSIASVAEAIDGLNLYLADAQHEFGDARRAVNYLQNNLDMRKP